MTNSTFNDAPTWMVEKMIAEGGGIRTDADGVHHYIAPGEDPMFEAVGAFVMGTVALKMSEQHHALVDASIRMIDIIWYGAAAMLFGALAAEWVMGWRGYNGAALAATWLICLPAVAGIGFTTRQEQRRHDEFLEDVSKSMEESRAAVELHQGATVN